MQPDIFGTNYACHLTDIELDSVDGIRRPIEPGEWGGNQRLAHRLQQREKNGVIEVTDRELCECYVKAWAYGDGTWQKCYFRPIVAAATRAGWTPPPELIEAVETRRAEVLSRYE